MKKIISKTIFLFLTSVVFVQLTFASIEVIVANFDGNVVYGSGGQWFPVKKGQLLKENDKIKTLSKSYVLLLFSDGTSVSLSENTELTIKSLTNDIILNLENGRTKSKVKPLQLGQKFEIRTPVSVASVRGTVFITSFIDDQAELVVEQGKVVWGELKNLDFSGGEITNFIEVGELEKVGATTTGLGEKSVLTKEQVNEYDNFFKFKLDLGENTQQQNQQSQQEQEVKQETQQKEQQQVKEEIKNELKNELVLLKQELKEFVREVKNDNFNINEIVQQTKANDFETARSLVDVHGNLTRVEQSISRPQANSIEFVNITKRNNYNYKGQFNYVVENKPRVDLLTFSIEFNQNLPQKINDLPSFIVSKGEDFYPTKVSVKLYNGKDIKGSDSLVLEGTFTKIEKINSSGKKETKLESSVEYTITNANGESYKVDKDRELPQNYKNLHEEGKNNTISFWHEAAVPVLDKDGKPDVLWLQNEGYVIDNSGKILTEKFFNNSSLDPFSMLKQVAAESIVFVRRDDNGKVGEPFFKNNIDLIMTPDIVVAMVKTFATSASNLKFSKQE